MSKKWDKRFLEMAELVSTWSKDPSSQVGAVVVDAKNRVVSIGFNGFPSGVSDRESLYNNRDEKLRRTIHAETNALLFRDRDVTGCTIFCTHPPCARCTSLIIQSGITRIVSATPPSAFMERWKEDIESATDMCEEACVERVTI